MPGTKWYFGIAVALNKTLSYFLQYFSKHILAELNDIWGSILAKYLPPQPQRWSVLSTLQIRASENDSHYRFIEYNNQKKTVKTLGHCMLCIYTSATILHMLTLNCHCFPKILWQCWLLKNKFIYKHFFFLIWFQLIFCFFLRKMFKRQKAHLFVSYAGFVTA